MVEGHILGVRGGFVRLVSSLVEVVVGGGPLRGLLAVAGRDTEGSGSSFRLANVTVRDLKEL